jgi:hypothetical protein
MSRVHIADEEKGEAGTILQERESHVTQSMPNGASLDDDVARQSSLNSSIADSSTAVSSVVVSDDKVFSSTGCLKTWNVSH